MKRIYILAITLALTLALCSCTGGNSGPTASEPPPGQDGRGDIIDDSVPAGADDTIMQGVFYYELIETSEDSGEISPREGAELVNNLLTDNGLYSGDVLSAGQCVYISFDELSRLTTPDFLLRRECYVYSVGVGTAGGGLTGDDYEAVYRVYVDRSGEKAAHIYDDSGAAATYDLVLYADSSAASTEDPVLTETITLTVEPMPLSRWVIADILTAGLAEWTGLDFSLNDVRFEERGITVDWSADSTLISGLDNRGMKPEFQINDAVSLNWFMMDSLAETFKDAFEETTIYYCSDGAPVTFTNPEDMAAQGLPALPLDKPYEGSAFYVGEASAG
jgi:hypothetical protein